MIGLVAIIIMVVMAMLASFTLVEDQAIDAPTTSTSITTTAMSDEEYAVLYAWLRDDEDTTSIYDVECDDLILAVSCIDMHIAVDMPLYPSWIEEEEAAWDNRVVRARKGKVHGKRRSAAQRQCDKDTIAYNALRALHPQHYAEMKMY